MISAENHIAIIAILLVLLALAVGIERSRAGRLIPGPAAMLVGTIALANLGVLPHRAASYDQIGAIAVPVGVFLLLLRADLRRIFLETGTLLRLYLIGAAASIVGVLVAWSVMQLPDGGKIAAVQLGNLIGGTVNVVALAHAVALDASRFTSMMAGAAVVMNLYLLAMGALLSHPVMRWFLPAARETADAEPDQVKATPAPRLDSLHLAALTAGAIATYAVSEAVLSQIGRRDLIIIVVSVAALLVANLGAQQLRDVAGDRELGTLLMYLFFGSLGASVDLRAFGGDAVNAAVFIAIAVFVHLALLVLAGRVLRATVAEVLVASIAGVAGPSTAAAMAAAFGQRNLITPGVLCGLLGFAAATFLGLALYGMLPA